MLEQIAMTQQDAAATDAFLNGVSDAVMGESPQSKDSAYLDGYLSGVRRGIVEGTMTLQIRWLSTSYLTGGFDGGEEPF